MARMFVRMLGLVGAGLLAAAIPCRDPFQALESAARDRGGKASALAAKVDSAWEKFIATEAYSAFVKERGKFTGDAEQLILKAGEKREGRQLLVEGLQRLVQERAPRLSADSQALAAVGLSGLAAALEAVETEFKEAGREIRSKHVLLAAVTRADNDIPPLEARQKKLQQDLEAQTARVAAQKDPAVKSRNQAILDKAQQLLVQLGADIARLADDRRKALTEITAVTGQSNSEKACEQLKQSLTPLVRIWNEASDRLRAIGDLHRDLSGPMLTGIRHVHGAVELQTPEGTSLLGEGGRTLLPGDKVRLGPGASASLDLLDGSHLDLGENSVLELAPVDGAKLESRLSKGVLRLRDWLRQSERYRVRTPTAVCAVRGTDFTLTLTAAGGHLAVGLGEVELRDGSGKTTTLKSGQQLSFEGEKPATGPTPVSREDYESLKLTPFRDLE